MPGIQEAHRRHHTYYVAFTQFYPHAFDLLDQEFAQIQTTYTWIVEQSDREAAQSLLKLIEGLAPYFQRRALHSILLDYCQSGLRAARQLGVNPGWLHLLTYEAYWAIGEWDKALDNVQVAIETTRDDDPKVHAQAMLALEPYQ